MIYFIYEVGKKLEDIRSEESREVMELDEMHSYIGSKKLYPDLDCY